MKTSRREFLGALAASPLLLGMQDKAGSKAPVMGSGAYTYEATHDWGVLPPQIKWGNTHGVVEDAQGHIYVHHTVHATSDSADTVVVFDAQGQVRAVVGQGVPRRRARPVAAQGRARRVPLPDGQRREPEDDAAAGNAGGRRQDDAQGRDRLEDRGAAATSTDTSPGADGARGALQPDQRRDRAERRRLRRRRLRFVLSSISTTSKAEYIRTFGGRGSEPGKLAEPHGIWVDTRGKQPDARRRRSPQQPPAALHAWTASTSTSSPASGCPCHFDERKGLVVIPDLHGRVTLMDKTQRARRAARRLERPELEQPAAPRAARQVHPRPVHLPARRLLRSRRQHLRRRMGRGGDG